MKPKETNYLILTITFSIAFLIWGTIIVYRVVVDQNYHAPTPTQSKIESFKDCTINSYGKTTEQCKNLVDGK